jgi:hypothetical protein
MNVARLVIRLCAICCIAATTFAGAATPADAAPERVGRIAFLEGRVAFFADREEGWRDARLNLPVTADNSIETQPDSRAEVRVGASAFRFDGGTAFDFLSIGGESTRGALHRGSVAIRVRAYFRDGASDDFADKFRIEVAGGEAVFESDGRYRIDADAAGQWVRITVFRGRARFERADLRLPIDGGRALDIGGASGAPDFRYRDAVEDGFDRWAANRDARWDRAHDRHARDTIISPYMTGYEELDDHGDWFDDRDYGWLWAPRVVHATWAPYRYGHWVWVRPWGWTWVDDAPWGFAPFHHGRWVYLRGRWCWWPGRYHPRPAYAPALVAWLGHPRHGVAVGAGPFIGWFPLAPREYYVPRYPHHPGHRGNINFVVHDHDVRAPQDYRNRGPGATLVGHDIFLGGRPVGPHRIPGTAGTRQSPQVVAHIDALPHWRRNPSDATQMPDRWQRSGPAGALPAGQAGNRPPPAASLGPGHLSAPPGIVKPKAAPEAVLGGPAIDTSAPIQPGAPIAAVSGAPFHPPAASHAPGLRSQGAARSDVQSHGAVDSPAPRLRGRRYPADTNHAASPAAPQAGASAQAPPVHAQSSTPSRPREKPGKAPGESPPRDAPPSKPHGEHTRQPKAALD